MTTFGGGVGQGAGGGGTRGSGTRGRQREAGNRSRGRGGGSGGTTRGTAADEECSMSIDVGCDGSGFDNVQGQKLQGMG